MKIAKIRKSILVFILLFFAFRFSLFALEIFRGHIKVSPEIYLGPMSIRLYGLVLALAILAGYLLALRFAPRLGLKKEFVEGVLPWVVIFGFLGARLYFVAFSSEYFSDHPKEILMIWRGGLSIYGAIIGGTLAGIIYAKVKKISLLAAAGLGFLVLPLGQAIGRWGNFFNEEAFGRPTRLPWGLYVPPGKRPPEHLGEKFFHPAFLYESLWNLFVFAVLLYLFSKVKLRAGYLAGTYLILYSLGRFFIESLRLDSFYAGAFRVDQLTSLTIIILGAGVLIYAKSRVENS